MQEVVNTKSPSVKDQIQSGYEAVTEQVADTARTVKQEVATAARVAQDEAGVMVNTGIERVRGAAEYARSGVRAHPEKWLLIAMGAGVLAGACAQMMTHRRSGPQS